MQITLNGESRQLPDGSKAADLVRLLSLEGRRFAVEINGEIVPKSELPAHPLADRDVVEVVHAVGGG